MKVDIQVHLLKKLPEMQKYSLSFRPFCCCVNVKVLLYKVSCDMICNVKSEIVFLCTAVLRQDE